MCIEDETPGGSLSLFDMRNADSVMVEGDWYTAKLMRFLHDALAQMDEEHMKRMRCAYPREVEFMVAYVNGRHHGLIHARQQHNEAAQKADKLL